MPQPRVLPAILMTASSLVGTVSTASDRIHTKLPFAIDNADRIIGVGHAPDGHERAYLTNPVPLPALGRCGGWR